MVVALCGRSWWWRDGVAGCHKQIRRTTTDVVVHRLAAMLHLVGVKKEAGRVVCLLTWAGHDLVPIVLACCQPGGCAGGW